MRRLSFIRMMVMSLFILQITIGCSNAKYETVNWKPRKSRFIQIEKRPIREIAKEIRDYEKKHFSHISPRSLQFIAQKVKEICASQYGGRTKDVDFVFLSNKAFRRRIKSLSAIGSAGMAAVSTPAGISFDEADKVVGVMEDARIYINKDYPNIRWKDRKRQNILSLFRVLMIHEYIHSQTKLRVWKNGYIQIVDKKIPIAYSKGFKSALTDRQQPTALYMTLDETIVQLQANAIIQQVDGDLSVVLNGKEQVFVSKIVENSLILQNTFDRIGVDISTVNDFHKSSDLPGFQRFIHENKFTKEELGIINSPM